MDRYIFGMDTLLFKLEFFVNNYAGGTYKIYTLFERNREILVQMNIKNSNSYFGFGHVVPLDYFTQTYEIFNEGYFSKALRVNDKEMEEIVNCVIEYAEGN